jgi:hypothetical protein
VRAEEQDAAQRAIERTRATLNEEKESMNRNFQDIVRQYKE